MFRYKRSVTHLLHTDRDTWQDSRVVRDAFQEFVSVNIGHPPLVRLYINVEDDTGGYNLTMLRFYDSELLRANSSRIYLTSSSKIAVACTHSRARLCVIHCIIRVVKHRPTLTIDTLISPLVKILVIITRLH